MDKSLEKLKIEIDKYITEINNYVESDQEKYKKIDFYNKVLLVICAILALGWFTYAIM